ncbi:MAG: hypothetical protein JO356_02930 [Acidobacteria bacterium]|nr:hypothetical protein [Acidobacteriota bacterium]
MLANLPSAYLKLAEKAYGRKFANDDDLIRALKYETFTRRDEFLARMSESLGYQFTSPLEVFRLASGERLSEFGALSPPPGALSALEIARKAFGRRFSTPRDLTDYISAVPERREMIFQRDLIAAGWRAKKKTPTRRISLASADQLLSDLVERIPLANANRKFAFFVQEILIYGSYLRKEKTVGDIDIAMQFVMKTDPKLNERVAFFMRRHKVDWQGGYDRAVTEVSKFLTNGSKYFHDSDADNVKRTFRYRVIYRMPKLQQYVRLVDKTADWPTVEHLHEFLERAELNERAKKHRTLTEPPRPRACMGR